MVINYFCDYYHNYDNKRFRVDFNNKTRNYRMLIGLRIKQRQLAEFMSDLSERCYSASWLENLEYILWDTLLNGQRKFGHDNITQQDIVHLNQLSQDSNCWIYFDDKTEETATSPAFVAHESKTKLFLI